MTYAQTYDHGSLFMNHMNAKAYMDNHRDDHAPSFTLAPHSTERITERLQTRVIVVILDPKTLVIIAGPYEQLTPVNYTDRTGYSPEWWEWVNAIGKIATGIFAVAAGALVIASGVAGVGMLVVTGITATAGALTINNGIADTVGLSIGYNYMADGLFQGNTAAYGWYSGITEGVAVAGTIACGGWLGYNAPRISAYHNIGNYQFSNTLSDAAHMARPWQNSVLMQQNVIKYGRMAMDEAGLAFTAVGSFNGHDKVWRLIVSVAEETIWHWGFF